MTGPVKPTFAWTRERTEALIEMCREGLPYSQIGRSLGCSKNAAISKAKRVGLAGDRGNPVGARKPWTEKEDARIRSAWPFPEVTIYALAKELGRSAKGITGRAKALGLGERPGRAGDAQVVPSVEDTPEATEEIANPEPEMSGVMDERPASASRRCQWIENDDPKRPQFCGKKTLPGKPYCEEHCRRVYLVPKRRTVDGEVIYRAWTPGSWGVAAE